MQTKYINLNRVLFKFNKNNLRYIRGGRLVKTTQASKNAEKSNNQNISSIKIVKENIDLANNSNSANLSTIARLAIQSDSELLKSTTEIKQIKFSFNPRNELENFKNEFQTKTDQQILVQIREKIKIDHKKENPLVRNTDIKLAEEFLEEDRSHPISNVNCSGCGAKLHCQNKQIDGFIPANRFKMLSKKDLEYYICNRCHQIKFNQKLIKTIETSQFDYDKFILEKILSQKKAHVILLVDLLNIPNSIYDGWSKLIKNKKVSLDKNEQKFINKYSQKNAGIDICVIGNKFDLLPNTGPGFNEAVFNCLLKNLHDKGICGDQVKHVELVSAKTGYNIEKMISALFELWNDEGDVYLLGMANAGKSVLFNKLLSSDYCRALASEAMTRATTSFWPGTTINTLSFPITFLSDEKSRMRAARLLNDRERFYEIETNKQNLYKDENNLKLAECYGLVGSTFKPFSKLDNQIDARVDSTYKLDQVTGQIREGENFQTIKDIQKKRIEEAREQYTPKLFKNKAAWLHDTPGVLGELEILRNFSKQELQIIFPTGIIMPRIYWMTPGQSMFIGGVARIDLLESTKDERVLFTIMASPALPIVNPFQTSDAERLYEEYYEKGNILRVPHKQHEREKPLPKLEFKQFEIDCIGNYKSTADIVFSCFGFAAVTSRPETKAVIRAFTLGKLGLELRKPSLLPYIVNMRKKWSRKDQSQSFKSVFYRRPSFKL